MVPVTSFKENKLFIDNKLIKEFDYPLKKTCDFFDRIVVLFHSDYFKHSNENVICVDLQGQTVWQVPKREYLYAHSPFVNISEIDPKLVKLWNWDGSYMVIKPETGEIVIDTIESYKNRRPW